MTSTASSQLFRICPVDVLGRIILGLVGCACAALMVVLATYQLDAYPTTWFDEGSHLHVPKALLLYGVYADTSSEGFRYFGPTSGIGPTIMLPVALMFKLTGIGLLQARLVITFYFLAALVLFVGLSRRLFGAWVAALASLLLVSSPSVNVLYLGRQVLGEVPAFAFLMFGALLWFSATESTPKRRWRLLAASVAFGLAALTKNQLTLILVPTFIVAALVDRFYYRSLGIASFALPFVGLGLGVAAGLLVQFLPALSAADIVQTLSLYRDASAGAIFVFSPARIASSLKFLTSADVFGFWGLPAVVYGVYLARQRSVRGAQQSLLAIFVVVGLAWFAFGSIGWIRYAFPALAVTAMFAAKLLVDLLCALANHALRDPRQERLGRLVTAGAVALVTTQLVVAPLATEMRAVFGQPDRSPQELAAFLNANIETTGTVIETWEPELGFLTDHVYHYPPSGWLDRAVRATWLTPATSLAGYDPIRAVHPDYLVIGPFGKYSRMYDPLVASLGTRPVASFGAYDVYRLARTP